MSAEDAEWARKEFGVDNLDVVDNGVDAATTSPRSAPPTARERSSTWAALDWRPNLDALEMLLGVCILPRRRLSGLPDAKLAYRRPIAAGVAPSPRRVKEMPNVELHANVPDVLPRAMGAVMAAARLSTASGGGLRLKTSKPGLPGLPVVSTKVGAEGLALHPGKDYFLADSTEEMADALARC